MTDDQFTVDGIFQARVSSKRESKAGIFLTVEIPADDYSPALAQLRAGSLLKMGWQELVDTSVQPIEVETPTAEDVKGILREDWAPPNLKPAAPKPKKAFSDYPLSAQCAMRCEEPAFMKFLQLNTVENVIDWVRNFCDVNSRSELDKNAKAAAKWRVLDERYQRRLTDQRHAESVRR